jgi:hypothetical protein
MNMKPCNFEQELLFSLHRMDTIWGRMRMGWHCMLCPECRRRRAEFAAASRALMTLRPNSLALTASLPGSRRTRLIMCSAAIAIAAAALSYYLTLRTESPQAPTFAQNGSTGVAAVSHCAPPTSNSDVKVLKTAPVKLKSKRRSGDKALVSR